MALKDYNIKSGKIENPGDFIHLKFIGYYLSKKAHNYYYPLMMDRKYNICSNGMDCYNVTPNDIGNCYLYKVEKKFTWRYSILGGYLIGPIPSSISMSKITGNVPCTNEQIDAGIKFCKINDITNQLYIGNVQIVF